MRDFLEMLVAVLIFPGFAFLLVGALAFEWADRKLIARVQGRVGPPWYQPLADLIKLLAKEDILPRGTREGIAALLPILSLSAVVTAALYIPVADRAASSFEGDFIVVLFLLSLPSLGYFGAGWVTGGVYSVLGGSRALLQHFAYEVPFLMAVSAPTVLTGSWTIAEISARQAVWGLLVMPVGFAVAVIGLIGKLKRDPLDIPKAKSEVVGGSLTEFSGRKLALWRLSISMQTVVGIFLLVNLFAGGTQATYGALPAAFTPLFFALKAVGLLLVLSLTSALFARLRIDQFAQLGWRVLAPLALLQIAAAVWIGG